MKTIFFLTIFVLMLSFSVPSYLGDTPITKLLVKSDPSGAKVQLDNGETDTTPHEFVVKYGRHEIKVWKPGYTVYLNKDVIATLGTTTTVYAPLRADPYYGTITILTKLGSEGGEIFVDGVSKGITSS